MIVSTSDDLLSSRNHKRFIITMMQIQNCSPLCVSCYARWQWQSRDMLNRHISPCAVAGLWFAMGTGMQLCYIPAHLVYSSLGLDQSKALTSFCIFPGCDTPFCFSERINKWLPSKLINSETFLPRTSTLFQRYAKSVPEHCLSNSQHSVVLP